MKLFQLSLAVRLYAAFALVLLVTITLAVFAVVRVNSIEASLDNAEAFRTARLDPLLKGDPAWRKVRDGMTAMAGELARPRRSRCACRPTNWRAS